MKLKSLLNTIFLASLLPLLAVSCKQNAVTTSGSEVKSSGGLGHNGRWFEIQNWVSNECIDVDGAGNRNGVEVLVYGCNNQWNQRWQLHEVWSGVYEIKSQGGRCLDLKDGNHGDWSGFQVWDCVGNDNQRFWMDKVKDGHGGYHIVSLASKKILHHGANRKLQQAPRWQTGDWQVFKLNGK